MKKNKRQYQQGDVWLEEVNAIPEGARLINRQESGSSVLAHGEVTGHKHQIKGDVDSLFYEKDGQFYLVKKTNTPFTHDTHHAVPLMPKIYRFGQVVRKNYFKRIIEKVTD